MKIAVFENEYDTVEIAFRYLNKKYYGNSIKFDNFPRSDSISDIGLLEEYQLIIVDLDLSSQSKLDGFGLIRKMEQRITTNLPQILILTGQSLSNSFDTENDLKHKYPVLEKPVNYKKLYEKFKELGIVYEH